MLSLELKRVDTNGRQSSEGHIALANAFFNPAEIVDNGIDSILRGLATQAAQEIDNGVIDAVRNFLFGSPGSGGFDLASLNIQRGRDHGLADLVFQTQPFLTWQSMLHPTFVLTFSLCLAAIASQAGTLRVTMLHTHDGHPLRLDTLRYETTGDKETFSVTRLSYLLSAFALQSEDGEWTSIPGEAFIDAEKRRNQIALPTHESGKSQVLRFTLGLDETTNHADHTALDADHPLNPNFNGLHWSWQGGYIFLAIEGHFRDRSSGELSGYVYHFARNPNQTTINLPIDLDLTAEGANVSLTFASPSPSRRPRTEAVP
jgi:hypothetical protein